MKNLTWQNPEQLFVAQVLINKVKSKCCGIKVIYVSETTKQASPSTYEIQKDGSQYFIAPAPKRIYIDYDPAKDVLNLSSLGDYLRN